MSDVDQDAVFQALVDITEDLGLYDGPIVNLVRHGDAVATTCTLPTGPVVNFVRDEGTE